MTFTFAFFASFARNLYFFRAKVKRNIDTMTLIIRPFYLFAFFLYFLTALCVKLVFLHAKVQRRQEYKLIEI